MNIRQALAVGLTCFAAFGLSACSSQDAEPIAASETSVEVDPEVLSDMDDIWIFTMKTRQNEICNASNGGRDVDADVVDLYTLGKPSIYGSLNQVQAAIEIILLENCRNVAPLQDATNANAGAIAESEWLRTVNEVGGVSVACEFWRGNNFDQSIMFGAGPSAIERAGFIPEDGKVLEFVVSYDRIIRENCE